MFHGLRAVVESRVRRKKYRGGVGVFQYAQTVEDDVWKDEKSQKDIQVSHLLGESGGPGYKHIDL